MMRYASWLLSILLHVTVFTVLMQSIHLRPMDLEKLMELDLTSVEPADEVISPMPAPPPPPVAAPVPAPPEAPAEAAPLPMDKTLVLADEPALPAEPAPEPEPAEPGPEPVEISPVKVPVEPEKEQKELPRRIDVRKGDIIVHRGHEARFGRSMMGDYFSYSSSEFSGQFTTRDDRTISIIDARNTEYGRFLIYDSKNKTLRRLKQFAKYVFTIGPSLYEDEPVVGVVTFLAKDDRIERFVLTTDDDRLAHYPRKIHVREDNVTLDAPAGPVAGTTTLPPEGSGNSGVVFLSGDQCVDPGLIRGVTRSLAANDVASMILAVRGCDGEQGEPAGRDVLAQDAGAAVHFLSGNPRLKGGKVGLWGNGRGALVALDAATGATGFGRPDFLVCLLNDSVAPGDMPGPASLGKLDMPVLWLVTGRKTASWRPFITTLEKLRDKNRRPFTIVLAPLKASGEVDKAQGDLSAWVEQVTEDQSRLATSWIKSLDR